MGIFTTAGSIKRVSIGGVPAKKVYLGSTVVWSSFTPVPYQITKRSTQTGTGTSFFELTGMTPDAAYPGTQGNGSTTLEIPASAEPYTAVVRAEAYHTGGSAPRYGQVRIFRNGVQIVEGNQATGNPDTSVAQTTIEVRPLDLFYLMWRGEGNLFNRPVVQANSTFLRITPS